VLESFIGDRAQPLREVFEYEYPKSLKIQARVLKLSANFAASATALCH